MQHDPETLDLPISLGNAAAEQQLADVESLDRKAALAFTTGGVALGAATAGIGVQPPEELRAVLVGVAAGLWLVAAAAAIWQLRAVKYRRAGAPDVYHRLYRYDSPQTVKVSYVEDADAAFNENRALVARKATLLSVSMLGVALEVAAPRPS